MNKDKKISLTDAYAVETPDDSIQLYKDWADSYDEDFIAAKGYVGYLNAARFFLEQKDRPDGPVLDVGCGAGFTCTSVRMSLHCNRQRGVEIAQPSPSATIDNKTRVVSASTLTGGDMRIRVIDPVESYQALMETLFDFDAIIKRTYGYVLTTGAIAGNV